MIVWAKLNFSSWARHRRLHGAPSPRCDARWLACEEGPTFNERIQADLSSAGDQRGH
jgi:hypothetical protein